MQYERFEKLSLKNHPELNEKWVQQRLAEDPSILGLGDLILKDKERAQPGAGRLDLLFQHEDELRRYEVEVQLGKTDESHIIRTIEYWDIERKRYPQYEHTAVIVAEDITSRFLNVIGLFNGTIPLVAIQMNALRHGDTVSLLCTTVLGQVSLGLADEDEEIHESTDRGYWEKKASQATVMMADEILEILRLFDPALELKYNKFYIGLARNGQPSNFVIFRPKKTFLRLEPRLENSDEKQGRLAAAGLNVMEYADRSGRYRIRLAHGDVQKHAEVLTGFLQEAYLNASV